MDPGPKNRGTGPDEMGRTRLPSLSSNLSCWLFATSLFRWWGLVVGRWHFRSRLYHLDRAVHRSHPCVVAWTTRHIATHCLCALYMSRCSHTTLASYWITVRCHSPSYWKWWPALAPFLPVCDVLGEKCVHGGITVIGFRHRLDGRFIITGVRIANEATTRGCWAGWLTVGMQVHPFRMEDAAVSFLFPED